jgi:DNA-binding LacI/PurR family transcriptional regulator
LREALIKLGADPHHLQAVPLNWRAGTVAAGRQLAESLLAQEKRPTVVFTFSDTVAAGFNIPRDLSVAGRDNDEVGQPLWPALTTISQPLDEMARAAIELLTQPASERKARNVLCPVELIVRESTSEASSKRPTKAR